MQTDHRTGAEILDEATCWELLGATPIGRLAVSIGRHPDIFPVNHVVDGRTVLFRTAEGTKLAAALFGASVAFEVDGWTVDDRVAWSVVLKAEACEVESVEELIAADGLPLYPWSESPKHRVVRLVPTEISGRRFHAVDSASLPA